MVVPLGPGKFYGSSLPRPRIYTDVKLNDHRVDPPLPVLDPLMSWAQEAHWSMGGLSFKRLRLQGRIEGSVKKLQAEREKLLRKRNRSPETSRIGVSASDSAENKDSSPSPPPAPIATKRRRFTALIDEEDNEEEVDWDVKRGAKGKSDGDDNAVLRRRRMPARKLADDFDRVATGGGLWKNRGSPAKNPIGESETVASRTRSRRAEESNETVNVAADVNTPNPKGKKLKRRGEKEGVQSVATDRGFLTPSCGKRTSPRLAVRGSI